MSATAASKAVVGIATGGGRTYGVWATATGTGGAAVLGMSRTTTGWAVGVKGSSISPSGTGVRGIAVATSGNTRGVSGYVNSAAGTAGVFNNAAGGKIIRGQNNGVTKFTVDGSGNVTSAGRFTGNGSGLTGILFSQIGGLLGNSQFSGSYSNPVTLSNTSNVFYGDGSHLTGTGGGGGNYIWNGTSQQPNANFNISGTGTANAFNSATNYQIRSDIVVNICCGPNSSNLSLGQQAGGNEFGEWRPGNDNTFSGYSAGIFSGSGSDTDGYNTFSGSGAGAGLLYTGIGSANTISGYHAGFNNYGNNNTFIGTEAGKSNMMGSNNVFVGRFAGLNNMAGSNDVYIVNVGPDSGRESNTIRIGTQGTGDSQQNVAYFAGIYGSTSSSGVPVYINSDGLLGTQTSSLRFKEQVRDMGDSTSPLMKLRPVTFLYKPEYDKGDRAHCNTD